jgi:hypothetical protein
MQAKHSKQRKKLKQNESEAKKKQKRSKKLGFSVSMRKEPASAQGVSFLPTIEINTLEQLRPGLADLHLLVGR